MALEEKSIPRDLEGRHTEWHACLRACQRSTTLCNSLEGVTYMHKLFPVRVWDIRQRTTCDSSLPAMRSICDDLRLQLLPRAGSIRV
jgi:hypothetical protein